MNPIKILLADADEEFRQLLEDHLSRQPDLSVLESTGDMDQALAVLESGQADVMVMDLVLQHRAQCGDVRSPLNPIESSFL